MQATAVQQFEALKPLVGKLRESNRALRQANGELRAGLALADSAAARSARAMRVQQRLSTHFQAAAQSEQLRARRSRRVAVGLGVALAGSLLLHLR